MHCHFFRKICRCCLICFGQCVYVHRLLTCQYFDCELRLLKPWDSWNLFSIFSVENLPFAVCAEIWPIPGWWILSCYRNSNSSVSFVLDSISYFACKSSWLKSLGVVMTFSWDFTELIKYIKLRERRKSSR